MLDPQEFGKAMSAIVKDVTAPLLKRIEQLEARQPERGEKGDEGPPGLDAEPLDIAEVAKETAAYLLGGDGLKALIDLQVAESVAEYFAANPVQHGKDGRDGSQGPEGAPGQKGDPGKDGAGIADLLIDRDGSLVVSMTDGRMKALGKVVGEDGKPGAAGKDGADFSNFEMEYDGERTLTIRGNGGEIVKTLPIPMDRGYWMNGLSAKCGDVYTHDGSAWIAKRDTSTSPSTSNPDDWRLFARKGRDGRDLTDRKPSTDPVKLGAANA